MVFHGKCGRAIMVMKKCWIRRLTCSHPKNLNKLFKGGRVKEKRSGASASMKAKTLTVLLHFFKGTSHKHSSKSADWLGLKSWWCGIIVTGLTSSPPPSSVRKVNSLISMGCYTACQDDVTKRNDDLVYSLPSQNAQRAHTSDMRCMSRFRVPFEM